MHTPEDRSFLGHPRGLGYIVFTEAWERFSYYGMQSLLVLYMVNRLLHPGHIEHIAGFVPFRHVLETAYRGHLDIQPLASAIFGLYTGLVYLTPIAGGLLADRLLGRTRTITIGALLMAAGQFLIAFDVTFLVALTCLLIGVGCFKGNLASQVGGLYATGDNRRADAFQIYYIFINAGVIISPLIAGTLGEVYSWGYGFGAAGVGMLIGLAIYLSGRTWLPPDSPIVEKSGNASKPRLTHRERMAVVALLLLLPVLTMAIIGNQQIFNAYLVWAERNVNLIFFGKKMPTTWLITLDSIVSVSFLAGAVVFWRLWRKKFPEPPEIIKIGIGSLIAVTGFISLATGAAIAASTRAVVFNTHTPFIPDQGAISPRPANPGFVPPRRFPDLAPEPSGRDLGVRRLPGGYDTRMTDDTQPADVVDDQTTDVLAEDEVVHVPPAVEDLADSQEAGSTFLPDVPGWDDPEHA